MPMPARLSPVYIYTFAATLTAVFTEFGASGREYRSKIDMLHQYMRSLRMPQELRDKLKAYFELCFPTRRVCHAPRKPFVFFSSRVPSRAY